MEQTTYAQKSARKTKIETFTQIQQVILSTDQTVLESDNKIFTINLSSKISNKSLFDFLEVVFNHILLIELGDDELLFPKVNILTDTQTQFYDFRFGKMCYQNEIAILWTISLSPNIEAHIEMQQQKNNHLLHLENQKM
jgi:hypothetical protein